MAFGATQAKEHGVAQDVVSIKRLDVSEEIAALRHMAAGQLREKYQELFGERSRSGNRNWLFRRCAWRVQALAEGGLSERARLRAQELAREADLRLRPPKDMVMDPATGTAGAAGRVAIPRDARLPMPGAVLRRVFKGHEYLVTVLPDGFEHNGEFYRSLSAVAHAITGSHWNGFLFFGIQEPPDE
jgi:hypothetical protein